MESTGAATRIASSVSGQAKFGADRTDVDLDLARVVIGEHIARGIHHDDVPERGILFRPVESRRCRFEVMKLEAMPTHSARVSARVRIALASMQALSPLQQRVVKRCEQRYHPQQRSTIPLATILARSDRRAMDARDPFPCPPAVECVEVSGRVNSGSLGAKPPAGRAWLKKASPVAPRLPPLRVAKERAGGESRTSHEMILDDS